MNTHAEVSEAAITVVIVDDHPVVRAGMRTVPDRAGPLRPGSYNIWIRPSGTV